MGDKPSEPAFVRYLCTFGVDAQTLLFYRYQNTDLPKCTNFIRELCDFF